MLSFTYTKEFVMTSSLELSVDTCLYLNLKYLDRLQFVMDFFLLIYIFIDISWGCFDRNISSTIGTFSIFDARIIVAFDRRIIFADI